MTLIRDVDARVQSLLENEVRRAVGEVGRTDWPTWMLDRKAQGRVYVLIARADQLPTLVAGILSTEAARAAVPATVPA